MIIKITSIWDLLRIQLQHPIFWVVLIEPATSPGKGIIPYIGTSINVNRQSSISM